MGGRGGRKPRAHNPLSTAGGEADSTGATLTVFATEDPEWGSPTATTAEVSPLAWDRSVCVLWRIVGSPCLRFRQLGRTSPE